MKCLVLSIVLITGSYSPNPVTAQIVCDATSSVVGSGSDYNSAFRDAQNHLPPGAQVSYVRTRQDGSNWYVTIYYTK